MKLDQKLELLEQTVGSERIKKETTLKDQTFNKLEAIAEYLYVATTQRELINILDLCYQLKIPYLVIGGGTKLIISSKKFAGLVIKNRTAQIKIAGFKGKVDKAGLDLSQALLEVDSGVSIAKLNEYLIEQKLKSAGEYSANASSIGGSLFIDQTLQERVQQVKVWYEEEVVDIPFGQLERMNHIIVSAIFTFKAKRMD